MWRSGVQTKENYDEAIALMNTSEDPIDIDFCQTLMNKKKPILIEKNKNKKD